MAKAQKIQYKEPSISQKDLKIIFQQFAKNIYMWYGTCYDKE